MIEFFPLCACESADSPGILCYTIDVENHLVSFQIHRKEVIHYAIGYY